MNMVMTCRSLHCDDRVRVGGVIGCDIEVCR